MTTSREVRRESKVAIFVLVAVLAIGFVIGQPALAANNGNGNGNNGNLIANNQSIAVDENSSVNITLIGSGPNGFTYVVATQPTHGVLTGTAPGLTYAPNTNFDGSDSFTFYTKKGGNDSTPATVSITVNNVPLVCDAGFHEENNACLVDEEGSNSSGSQQEGNNGEENVAEDEEGENNSNEGTNNGSVGDESSEENANTESGADNEGGNSDEGGNDEQQQPEEHSATQPGNTNGIYRIGGKVAHGLIVTLDGGAIPEAEGLTMYEIRPGNGVLFASMMGAYYAGYDWNTLTEGQQVWLVLHFGELVSVTA